jgi:hypothetical protein
MTAGNNSKHRNGIREQMFLLRGRGDFAPELRLKRNELLFHRKRMHV